MKKHLVIALCALTSCVTLPYVTANVSAPIGKKITCPQMKLLNSILTANPEGVVRMKLSSRKIRGVLKLVAEKKGSFKNKKEEAQFVQEQLATTIKPVQEFLDKLQDPDVINMVKPIVTSGLSNPATSHILKFCNSSKNILGYCEEEITSCATLESICSELLEFFSSIVMSLSDNAQAAVKQLEDSLKAAGKKK